MSNRYRPRRSRRKTFQPKWRRTYALAACTNDGKPAVALQIGKEIILLTADEVEELRVRLELSLIDARDRGGET